MPTYDYKCNSCGHEFEAKQRITDKPLRVCPKCNGSVKRLLSATAFALKGGGWYKDGYSSPAPKKDVKSNNTKKPKPDKKEVKKKDK